MKILAARKYPNPRNGPLSRAEAETRRLAYAIKDLRSPTRDFETAACEMAALITGPCWLVPLAASDGSTRANTILAAHIARHRPGTQIAKALARKIHNRIEQRSGERVRRLENTEPNETTTRRFF